MRALVCSAAFALLCSACVADPPAPPTLVGPVTDFQSKVAADDPNCREYTGQAMIDGKEQPVVGRACQQADGSWKIAEGTADNPGQYTAVFPAAPYAGYYPGYYPYYYPGYYYADLWPYDPWFWGPPFGFGASFVFFDHHHHGGHDHFGHFGHGGMTGHGMAGSHGGHGGHGGRG